MFHVLFSRQASPDGVDLVLEVTGSSSVVPEGLKLLRYGGHYAFAGMVHPATKLDAVTGEDIIRKCVSIRGSHNYTPKHLRQAVQFVADHVKTLPFEDLVGPPMPLSALPQAVLEAKKAIYPRVAIKY